MKAIHITMAAGVAAFALTSTAHAAVDLVTLTEGTGWHYGESHAVNDTHMFNWDALDGNQFTLTVDVTAPEADLSFVDGYNHGDVYLQSIKSTGGTVTYKSQFLDASNYDFIPNMNAGPFGSTFGPAWLDSGYGHIQANLTMGTYALVIRDVNGCCGFPAGWGIRLDAVPEPGTWALMLMGFAGLGSALRSRRSVLSSRAR